MKPTKLKLTPEQIRYIRARRTFLTQERATDPFTCVRALMGVQAQVYTCALHAIAMRTAGFPTAEALMSMLFETHQLVRTWGQRDTLHIYEPETLPILNAARGLWKNTGRRGGMPDNVLVEDIAQWFMSTGGQMTRTDLIEVIPPAYIEELRDHPSAASNPERFAATRMIWCLARAGHIVFAKQVGKEQAYAHRQTWLPDLDWSQPTEAQGAAEATRRYLQAFGPATIQDIAHHVGTTITLAKTWMSLLDGELIQIACDGKKGLMALAADEEVLRCTPEPWPARMLPAYDTMLMGHKDKRWLLPEKVEEKLVWKRAAVVRATVIAQGQIVATWDHKKRSKEVDVTIQPMSLWRADYLQDVTQDAQDFAAHLGLKLGSLTVV